MKLSNFAYLSAQGVSNMARNKMMTIASIGILSSCLALTGIAYLVSANVNSVVDYMGAQNETIVYLPSDASDESIDYVQSALDSMSGVESVIYVSKEEVLETYKGYTTEGDDLWSELEYDNPFKSNFKVVIEDLENIESISNRMASIDGVDSVSAPLELAATFVQVQDAVSFVGMIFVIVFGLISIVVIGNTIRLTVYSRRREVEIMRYVGAMDIFIRLPFFIEGVCTGFISATISTCVTLGAYYMVSDELLNSSGLFQSIAVECLLPLDVILPYIVLSFYAFGMFFGGLGCITSLRKHLTV